MGFDSSISTFLGDASCDLLTGVCHLAGAEAAFLSCSFTAAILRSAAAGAAFGKSACFAGSEAVAGAGFDVSTMAFGASATGATAFGA